jgi:hypothetical protein
MRMGRQYQVIWTRQSRPKSYDSLGSDSHNRPDNASTVAVGLTHEGPARVCRPWHRPARATRPDRQPARDKAVVAVTSPGGSHGPATLAGGGQELPGLGYNG